MTRRDDLRTRKQAAEQTIAANAAAVAAVTGATPVTLPDSSRADDSPQDVALLEIVAQLAAAVADHESRIDTLEP